MHLLNYYLVIPRNVHKIKSRQMVKLGEKVKKQSGWQVAADMKQ